jgi:hypothetical protein
MEKRAHARRCSVLPKELELEGAGWWSRTTGEREWVDLMIEAKDKEQAVFELYRMYDLVPVIWENLRPEQTDSVDVGQESAITGQTRRKTKNKGLWFSSRIVEVKVRIRSTGMGEECDLGLPAGVDPVTVVGKEREELPQSPETKRAARPRGKPNEDAN